MSKPNWKRCDEISFLEQDGQDCQDGQDKRHLFAGDPRGQLKASYPVNPVCPGYPAQISTFARLHA